MPFKPNYRMQRADRKRAQAEKQQKKLDRRAARAAQRKGENLDSEVDGPSPGAEDEGAASES
jgi:hypothetical protein